MINIRIKICYAIAFFLLVYYISAQKAITAVKLNLWNKSRFKVLEKIYINGQNFPCGNFQAYRLCISKSKQVLCASFAGQNHVFSILTSFISALTKMFLCKMVWAGSRHYTADLLVRDLYNTLSLHTVQFSFLKVYDESLYLLLSIHRIQN